MAPARHFLALSALLLLSACQTEPRGDRPRPVVSVEAPSKTDAWLAVASGADERRIRNHDAAWAVGLSEARKAGFTRAVADEGLLLEADAGLPYPAPTPGSYSCRLVKIGSSGKGKPAFERFKPFFCYVQVDGLSLTIVKQTGSQRPAGRFWEDDNSRRLIFLGSLALGNEETPLAYGDDPRRDMAGYFERIAPFRWRLVIPWPQDGAKLNVFELTPVPEQPK